MQLPFLAWAPMIFISALEKQRVRKILDLALEVKTNQDLKIPQTELDDILNFLVIKHQPKQRQTITYGQKKKMLKLISLTQVSGSPPTFILQTPKPKNVSPAIPKILEKQLREKYDFLGTTIRIIIEE